MDSDGVPVDGDGENCALFTGNKASNKDWADVACNLEKRHFSAANQFALKVEPFIFLINNLLKEFLLSAPLGPVPLSALFSYFFALLFL